MSHSYKTIYNWPVERQRKFYSWCYWDNAFNDEELDKIEELMSKQKLERGTTIGQKKDDDSDKSSSNVANTIISPIPGEKHRKSNVKFVTFNNNQNETDWIFHRLNHIIESINNQYFNFDLNGYDSFQYTVYHDYEKGEYDFHQDTIMGKDLPQDMYETRKLSMTFLVNDPEKDFEGGEFQINSGKEEDAECVPFVRGRIILFPSFLIHRVKPITKGTRKSIVVWVMGPKFK